MGQRITKSKAFLICPSDDIMQYNILPFLDPLQQLKFSRVCKRFREWFDIDTILLGITIEWDRMDPKRAIKMMMKMMKHENQTIQFMRKIVLINQITLAMINEFHNFYQEDDIEMLMSVQRYEKLIGKKTIFDLFSYFEEIKYEDIFWISLKCDRRFQRLIEMKKWLKNYEVKMTIGGQTSLFGNKGPVIDVFSSNGRLENTAFWETDRIIQLYKL